MSVYNASGNEIHAAQQIDGITAKSAYGYNGTNILTFPPTKTDLVVMTYNVGDFGGRNSDRTLQSEIISTYDPDIIGLQEVTRNETMPVIAESLFSGYTNKYLGTQENKSAIVSKLALADVSAAVFASVKNETRGYQKGYITVKGKTIAVFNTHLEVLGNPQHILQAKEFFDELQKETSFIALGDFNIECHSINDPEYINVIKQYADAGYHLSNWTSNGFIDTWYNASTIAQSNYKCPCDNIITSSDINISSVVYDPIKLEVDTYAIDHIAVIGYLTI